MKIKRSLLLIGSLITSVHASHSLRLDNPCKVIITDCDTEGENFSHSINSFFKSIKGNNADDVKRSLTTLKQAQPNILQNPNLVNDFGFSPLACALWSGANINIIDYLLKKGAPVDFKRHNGDSLLDVLVQETPINLHFHAREVSERFYYYAIAKKLLALNCDIQQSTVEAAKKQGLEDLHTLLTVNNFDKHGRTPLMKICPLPPLPEAECIAKATNLLAQGACINRKGKKNTPTPLIITAVFHRYYSLLKLLLEHGANPNQTAGDGKTALHHHIIWGINNPSFLPVVDLLLLHGANINQRDNKGLTPLHLLATGPQNNHITEFLNRGAKDSINAQFDEEGGTILHYIIRNGNYDAVRLLAKTCRVGHISNIQDKNGQTALHYAIKHYNPRRLDILYSDLLKQGANPYILDDKGNNLIHMASIYGKGDLVSTFIRTYPRMKIEPNKEGSLPLHLAIQTEDPVASTAIAHRLLNGNIIPLPGSDSDKIKQLNHTNKKGETPLYLAAQANRTSLIKLLALHENAGQSINQATLENKTPLFEVVHNGNLDAMKLLIAAGARPQNDGQRADLILEGMKHQQHEIMNELHKIIPMPKGPSANENQDERNCTIS